MAAYHATVEEHALGKRQARLSQGLSVSGISRSADESASVDVSSDEEAFSSGGAKF